ncbi:MAG TPA: DUF3326 domain-containing protein [Steroidobacteraceae bacterium]|nr:DUF3326 domain-containing protein [Steroidobacteraceae bacterium]
MRSAICEVNDREALADATFVEWDADEPCGELLARLQVSAPRRKSHQEGRFAVVQIVPTGVRCEIGGFAGDACPATNLLAASADLLITHPNAVNASELNEMAANVLYVEGRSLDDLMLGQLGLAPSRANRIGTFIDPTGAAYLDDVVHALNAARATGGIDCGLHSVGREDFGVAIDWSAHGCAVGTVRHPDVILEVVGHLLSQGAEAIGGVSVIHGVSAQQFSSHLEGKLPNPSGGIEAIITHLISRVFRIPTAHAPLPYYQAIKQRGTHNPRASAEFISTPHYFCVLKGLARAPRLVPLEDLQRVPSHLISLNNVGAVVAPASCLGGTAVLAADFNAIPIIAVRENGSVLDVSNERMGLRNVIEVASYPEAAGVVLALRKGISLESVRRPLGRALHADIASVAHLWGAAAAL